MKNYSYNYSNTATKEANTTTPTTAKTPYVKTEKLATPGQIKYYSDLCIAKEIEMLPTDTMTFAKISSLIETLKAYNPVKAPQMKMITDKIALLNSAGKDISISEETLKGLTGGYGGTASVLIEQLKAMEAEFSGLIPINEYQVGKLVEMYLCPDVAFDEIGIVRRIELGNGLWRRMTPNEFATQLINTVKHKEASAFIDKYRAEFYTWKKSRLNPGQMEYIKTLELRLTDDRKLRTHEFHINQDGVIEEVVTKVEHIEGLSYTPLTDDELLMFSKTEADEFINQLKSEVSRKDKSSLTEETFKDVRPVLSVAQAIDVEYEEFKNLMFKLEAVAGYADDELHSSENYNLVADDTPSAQATNRAKVRNFIRDMIETGAITISGLMDLLGESVTAQRILLDM